ncbi:hypothetical protein [Enterobacter cancerogenus]|uniref:hypothetical protein n=1 Tax=Enterobacter cancerogenus TaxID=69218 RepID=UPI0012997711|nr:hypothetical protein [Enterobacter cancerogenus]MRG31667.1 hypothetical protein [Enterobacter cancerogenus]
MSTITNEWLQQKIAEMEATRDEIPFGLDEDDSNTLAALRIALASLEAEPVTEWTNEQCLEFLSIAFRHAEIKGDLELDDIRLGVKMVNGSRAAMLQGAEPVTTANKLPFEQWISQQTGTIDVECGCVMTEVFFHWLRVAYEAGNSPHCREILNSSTNNFRENAETSTKCQKCGGRGSYHCPQMLGTVECECTLSAPQEVAIR